MDATPSKPGHDTPRGGQPAPAGRPQFAAGSASALGLKWRALHDAAAAVGTIAGLPGEPLQPHVRHFPVIMRDAGGWRRDLAEQGIEDLTAIMEPGLSALLAAHARGANPAAAARALWHEFHAARDALLALTPPPER